MSLENLVDKIKLKKLPEPSEHALSEINYLIEQIEIWQNQLVHMRELEKQAAINQLITQLAHDIRSPLSALDMAVQSINTLPEEIRVLLRQAAIRIQDIANSLLHANKQSYSINTNTEDHFHPQLLSSIINLIVTEKRLQYKQKTFIEITHEFDLTSYGLFAIINTSDFKRLLSNLVDNAVEALNEKGKISISLYGQNNEIKIIINDNGKGIPDEIISKLGQRGFSHNKPNGSGLGIFHAKTTINQWGGDLKIASMIKKGTSVILTLPKTKPPAWFVPSILLAPKQYFVIIDDDASIHEIWKIRVQQFSEINKTEIILKHFYSILEAKEWIKQHSNSLTSYLCDYEFVGQDETGLDLIEELSIPHQTKLVTSRFDDQDIIKKCEQIGIGIIPKDLARLVPISLQQEFNLDAILIDDDNLVHSIWSLSAKKHRKNLKMFHSPDEFFSVSSNFSYDIPIYIDSNLGLGVKGEKISEQIYAAGFKNIYLVTGLDPISFSNIPHIKNVLSKDPAWL